MTATPPLALNAWLRWDLIERQLRSLSAPQTILELGCGQGAVGARLARTGSYTGVEPDPTSRATARGRLPESARLVDDLSALPPSESFDLVCAFEVLEHIEDDDEALHTWVGHVNEGGHVLVSVPAHQRRFGAWDDRVGHLRRYERAGLVALLQGAGLEIVRIDASGFPLGNVLERCRNGIARAERHRPRSVDARTAASGRAFQPPPAAGWLLQLLSGPFRLAQRRFRHRALGTGWVATARRPPA